jgi:hypothetical protein
MTSQQEAKHFIKTIYTRARDLAHCVLQSEYGTSLNDQFNDTVRSLNTVWDEFADEQYNSLFTGEGKKVSKNQLIEKLSDIIICLTCKRTYVNIGLTIKVNKTITFETKDGDVQTFSLYK